MRGGVASGEDSGRVAGGVWGETRGGGGGSRSEGGSVCGESVSGFSLLDEVMTLRTESAAGSAAGVLMCADVCWR